MMFPDQVAQLVVIRGPNGEIKISVLDVDGDPRIEFRVNPASADPDAVIRLDNDDDTLLIDTDRYRMVFGSDANPNAGWQIKKRGSGFGIKYDDSSDTLRALRDPFSAVAETWELVTSFSNGWTALLAAPPQFYLDAQGFVHLYGRAIPGVTADGTVVMTLPAGYRPARNYFVPCMQDNAPYVRPGIEVQSGGNVRIFNWSAGNLTFDAVSFCTFLA